MRRDGEGRDGGEDRMKGTRGNVEGGWREREMGKVGNMGEIGWRVGRKVEYGKFGWGEDMRQGEDKEDGEETGRGSARGEEGDPREGGTGERKELRSGEGREGSQTR